MASSVAMLGLFPAALSRGIGSETQKPLAIVVIGGALALAILPRLLQPALLLLAFRKRPQPDLVG
jgi:cobalt-zinc-cadmium resistance protein CzcA